MNKSGKKVYSQIDFVLCKRRSKCLLGNARSYGSTKLCSEHKLLVVSVNTQNRFRLNQRNRCEKKFDCNRLASCKETQLSFKREVAAALSLDKNSNVDPNSVLDSALSVIHKCAEKIVGIRRPKQKCHRTNDPVVVDLSNIRRKLRVELESYNKDSDKNRELKKSVNRIGRAITKRMKFLESQHADRLAEEITSTGDSRSMFEAVRSLAKVKEPKPIVVHNEHGNPVGTDKAKAEIVREWYVKKFNGDDPPLTPFMGTP